MPLTNKQKADNFKARQAAQGLKELRGVYVPVAHEKSIKAIIREMVKGLVDGGA